LAWVTRGLGADENLAARVLMHHLCNPVDGPVYLRLIEAGCLPPRWSQQAWQLGGMLVLSVDLPEGVSVDPEQVVREELEQTAREVRSETSFDRARALAVREVRNRQSDFGCYALRLGLHEVVAGDLRLSEWQVLRMQRLTARELQEAADELLHGRMICLPRVAGGGKIGAAEPGELSTGAESSPPGATSLPVRPEAEVGFPAAEWCEELIGRVRLRVCPTPGLELAEVRTLIGLDPNPVPALDALMAVGSVDRSVDQIRDYLSLWGLDLLPVAGLHGVGLVGRGPASRAAQMIELQAELLRRPNRTSSACHAAVQSVRRLQAWIDQIPCGRQQDWYVPPGLVGWRAGASFLLDAAWVKRNLSALDAIREVEIQVVGDVDSKKTAEIAALLWADWQPTAQTVSPSPSQPGHSE